ncbi:hypothetical protein [Pseudomonas oryzihabitans]|uniref:hypothetical protein n=1 Tax=Pseudomonas oryzihabitans TaxID=47885 RepID=UPI00119E330B|nr:hypothetical protein [Pseudomonas psychrotolerans]
MSGDNPNDVREGLLALHRQLQANAARLVDLEGIDPDARAVIKAVNELNELAAQLVAETALLVPAPERGDW